MSAAPPPKIRPTWKEEIIVVPKVKLSGSTSVACWLLELVKASVLSFTNGTVAGGKLVDGFERNWFPRVPEPQALARNKTTPILGVIASRITVHDVAAFCGIFETAGPVGYIRFKLHSLETRGQHISRCGSLL